MLMMTMVVDDIDAGEVRDAMQCDDNAMTYDTSTKQGGQSRPTTFLVYFMSSFQLLLIFILNLRVKPQRIQRCNGKT